MGSSLTQDPLYGNYTTLGLNAWGKPSDTGRVVKRLQMRTTASTINVRFDGSTILSLVANVTYEFSNIDLSQFECQSTSGTPVLNWWATN